MNKLGHKDWRMWAIGLAPYGALLAAWACTRPELADAVTGWVVFPVTAILLAMLAAGGIAIIATFGLALTFPFILICEAIESWPHPPNTPRTEESEEQ